MKKSGSHFYRLLLFAGFLLGLGYLYSSLSKYRSTESAQTTKVQSIDPAKKLLAQAKQVESTISAKLTEAEKIDLNCANSLEAIETLPMKSLLEDLKNNRINLDKSCLFKSTQSNLQSLAGFPDVCSVSKDKEISADCEEKLFLYKALRIHHNTSQQDLRGLPTEILLQKFFGIIADQSFSSPDGVSLFREASKELHQRLPESLSAAKANVISYLMDGNLNNDDQGNFDEALKEARQKFPNDWEIYEMSLIRKKMLDEDAFRSEILEYYAKQPQSAIANYYMGCIQWASGNIESARIYFKKASELGPGDGRFKETYENSLSKSAGDQVCAVKVNFNQDDF